MSQAASGLPNVVNTVHQTQPVVIHSPGRPKDQHPIFKPICDEVFGIPEASRPWFGCPTDLTILTWSSEPAGGKKQLLEKCLDWLGVPCTVLRTNREWRNWFKIPLTAQALPEVDTRYVMGMDSTDVVMVGSPVVALERFKRRQRQDQQPACKLLFAAERNHYPRSRELRQATARERESAEIAGEMPFCHLNTGGFIAETHAAMKWFREAWSRPRAKRVPSSDQGVWRQFYRERESNGEVAIDRRCEIFQNVTHYDPPDVVEVLRR